MQSVVIRFAVTEGESVRRGQTLVILEAMKMEHVVASERGGIVRQVLVDQEAMVEAGEPLVRLDKADVEAASTENDRGPVDAVRADLREVQARHAFGLDENRPDAVAKRRRTGQRTARENLADLVDEGTWVEYGALVIAGMVETGPAARSNLAAFYDEVYRFREVPTMQKDTDLFANYDSDLAEQPSTFLRRRNHPPV